MKYKNEYEKLVEQTGTTTMSFPSNNALYPASNAMADHPKRRIRWKPRYEEERQRRMKAEQDRARDFFIMVFVFSCVAAIAAYWGC